MLDFELKAKRENVKANTAGEITKLKETIKNEANNDKENYNKKEMFIEDKQNDNNPEEINSEVGEDKKNDEVIIDRKEIEEVQRLVNEYTRRIKAGLYLVNMKMADAICNYIAIGEADNSKYEIVFISDLMKIIGKYSPNEFSQEELKNIEEIFKQLGNSKYVFVESLLEFFGELNLEEDSKSKNDDNVETKSYHALNIEELDETSVQIIKSLIKYIRDNEIKLYSLLGDYIVARKIKSKDRQYLIDTIETKDFFKVLNDSKLLSSPMEDNKIYTNLSDFLSIDRNKHCYILSIKKLQDVINYFATNMRLKLQKNISFEENLAHKIVNREKYKSARLNYESNIDNDKGEKHYNTTRDNTNKLTLNSKQTNENIIKNNSKEDINSKNEDSNNKEIIEDKENIVKNKNQTDENIRNIFNDNDMKEDKDCNNEDESKNNDDLENNHDNPPPIETNNEAIKCINTDHNIKEDLLHYENEQIQIIKGNIDECKENNNFDIILNDNIDLINGDDNLNIIENYKINQRISTDRKVDLADNIKSIIENVEQKNYESNFEFKDEHNDKDIDSMNINHREVVKENKPAENQSIEHTEHKEN